MSYGADGWDAEAHGQMHVTGAGELAMEALGGSLLGRLDKAAKDEGLGVVVAPPPRAKLGSDAASLQKLQALCERLLLLSVVTPVCVHEAEVGL